MCTMLARWRNGDSYLSHHLPASDWFLLLVLLPCSLTDIVKIRTVRGQHTALRRHLKGGRALQSGESIQICRELLSISQLRLPVRPLRIKKIQDRSAAFVKRELLNIERLLRVSEARVFVYAETVACGDELRIRGFHLLDDLGASVRVHWRCVATAPCFHCIWRITHLTSK